MDALEAIAQRKSTRSYLTRTVEADKVDALVAAANNAPKASAIMITVIENADVLGEIDEAALTAMRNSGNDFLMSRAAMQGYRPVYGAPLMLILSAPENVKFGLADVSCAAANVTIAATALGLGSCYAVTPVMGIGASGLTGKIGIPEGHEPLCAVLLGYADGDAFSRPRELVDNVNYCR